MVMMVLHNGRALKSDELARLGIGGNNPPEPTPYEAIKLHIDDLFETAQGFLDGEPIANEAQAKMVSKLLDDARKARATAEAQRKIEAKPWDDGKAAVQALWTPLADEKKGRCALIADTAKRVLAPWLKNLEDGQIAKAKAAREEADAKAEAAHAAIAQADLADLEAREQAEILIEEAGKADRLATKAENARAQAKGGERATSLRSRWRVELENPVELARHLWRVRRVEFEEMLLAMAARDVNAGIRAIPGCNIIETREVV